MLIFFPNLQHSFFSSDLTKRLALELLQRVSNPPHMFSELDLDDEGAVTNVPQRISSRTVVTVQQKNIEQGSKFSHCVFYAPPLNVFLFSRCGRSTPRTDHSLAATSVADECASSAAPVGIGKAVGHFKCQQSSTCGSHSLRGAHRLVEEQYFGRAK